MIKLLTFDDLFPPLRLLKLLVELRGLSRFATKMTLVHGSEQYSVLRKCRTRSRPPRLFILKKVKPSSDRKMIKLLTFDDLFPPLRLLKLLVELRGLSRFATKMTLVHGSWAALSIEKISYSKSSSSQNLKVSIIDTSLYAVTIVPRLSNLYWVTRKIELTFASDQWSSLCNGLLCIYFCPHKQ